MSEPVIAQRKPCLVSVKEGKTYWWCTCGRSAKQPFCDGSHKDTKFEPMKWKAEESGDQLFCACKHTKGQPFCDGSHNNLFDEYLMAEEDDNAGARLVDHVPTGDGAMKGELENNCYIIRIPDEAMQARGTLRLYPAINATHGSDALSQFAAIADPGTSPIVSFGESDSILFVISGTGTVEIGGRRFEVGPETGVCVKSGEAFRIHTEGDEPMRLNISVCPECREPKWLDEMPIAFDEAVTNRAQGVDEDKQEAMADRFFQVLIDHEQQGTEVTQFIGEVPQGRAAHHRHLYEETITILSGEGFMWTDNAKTPVKAGDTIFLPLKQAHSLECTDPEGMRLIGVFYPSMSPAINY